MNTHSHIPGRGLNPFTSDKTSRCAKLALAFPLSVLALLTGCCTVQPPAPTPPAQPAAATSKAVAPTAEKADILPAGYQSLFDGKTLAGWAITDFSGHGEVKVEDGKMVLMLGVMTGVTWTNSFPKMNYEIELDAMRIEGNDFFCGLTFPVGEDPCSLILGGWGGGVVGLSSIDSEDAAHNETSKFMQFDSNRWYHVRLRVTPGKIAAWIDQEQFVNLETKDRNLSIRIEMELSKPLGLATYSTTGAYKNIRFRKL